MRRIVVFSLLVAVIAITCTRDHIAGGSGTETTNSFAYLESGKPAQNSAVFLIDPVKWISQAGSGGYIVDSTVTGNDGSFSFEYDNALQHKVLAIQIDHDSSGLFRSDISFKNIDGASFTLNKYRSFTGKIEGGKSSMRLLIGNTTYQSLVHEDGSFEFDKMPMGMYGVFYEENSELTGVGSVKITTDSIESTRYSLLSDRNYLITDFECGYKSPLSELSGISLFWYLYSDSVNKEYDYELLKWESRNPTNYTKTGNSSVNSYIDSDSDSSQALYFDGMLDSQCTNPYTGLGMVLYTDGDNGANFQGVDSLHFNAQGNGSMRVIFIAEHPATKTSVRFTKIVSLSQSSGVVSIALKTSKWDITPADSLRIAWADVCQKVRMIEFAFYGSENNPGSEVKFVIDNVVFVGDGVMKTIAGGAGR
jgi:hypothetical protein